MTYQQWLDQQAKQKEAQIENAWNSADSNDRGRDDSSSEDNRKSSVPIRS